MTFHIAYKRGLGGRGSEVRYRLLSWVETHSDESLAKDIQAFIETTDKYAYEAAIERIKNSPVCFRFTFERELTGWLVGEPNEKPSFLDDMKGMQYIHMILRKSGEPIAVEDFDAARVIDMPIETIDEKARQDSLRRKNKLNELIESALNRGDEDMAVKHDAELEGIEKYLNEATAKGKIKYRSKQTESLRITNHQAIKRALDKIKACQPAVYKELTRRISRGDSYTYTGNLDWAL